MYKLFTERYVPNNSISHPPNDRYIKDNYIAAILTIKEYFNSRKFTVKSNHLLVKILNDALIPLQYEFDRYLNIAYARSPFVAKLHKLTSEITYGKMYHGVFYYGCDEVLIYNESYIPPTFNISEWRDLVPVKVIQHGMSDMSLSLPSGKDNNTSRGRCTILIDIPMLLVMFRGYALEQMGVNSLVIIKQFIASNVLPNMLYSQANIAMFNRVLDTFSGAPFTEPTLKLPIVHQATLTMQDKVDSTISFTLKHIVDNPMRYTSMLKNIMSISDADSQESLLMPDLVRTKQIWWALYLSRVNYISEIIDIGGTKGIRKNRDLIADMRVTLKLIRNDNTYASVLNEDDAYDTKETINHLLSVK